jgi:hypothetical protein
MYHSRGIETARGHLGGTKVFTIAFLALSSIALAQTTPQTFFVDSSDLPRVYISPMVGDLDGFIAAEIIKQHLPMRVVMEDKDAQLVLVGLSRQENEKWFNIVFGKSQDRNEGNVRLFNIQSKTMIWAGEAGDRSLFYQGWKRGGERKVASRIVKSMKRESFDGRSAKITTAFGTPGGHPTVSGLRAFLRNDGGY